MKERMLKFNFKDKMKKIVKKISIFIFAFLLTIFLSFSKVSAQEETNFARYDYYISNYEVVMDVSEENVFTIEETITAYFNESKHGIYRKLPMRNVLIREDGSKSRNRAEISDVTVNENFTTSKSNGYYILKIGNENEQIRGEKTYIIKYKYNIGKDPLKNADEFYYNFIGTEWDTIISNVEFTINMPKEFDDSTLGFSLGSYGSSGYDEHLHFQVENKTIKGNYDNILNRGEGISVRLVLNEDYFVNEHYSPLPTYIYVLMFIPLLFIVVAFILWLKYGKDDEVVETVEFYPPLNMNSLDLAFAYKGRADSEDVISLLIYLANKGYLKIASSESDKNGFKITKLKEYDGNNKNEEIFFKGLFEKASNKDKEEISVSDKDLKYSFYKHINRILLSVNQKSAINKLFYDTLKPTIAVVLMCIATIFMTCFKPIFDYCGSIGVMAMGFVTIAIIVLFTGLVSKSSMYVKLFLFIWALGFGGIPLILFIIPSFNYQPIYYIGLIVAIISITMMAIFIKLMKKRTAYGNEILGKIRGFKDFLEVAQKDQLEALVDEDPQYFYNILPYAYVLKVSDKWMKKFTSIALTPPSWYQCDVFDVIIFTNFINHTLSLVNTTFASGAVSSHGGFSGGFSGGGFSGGGSGGGGGGSW